MNYMRTPYAVCAANGWADGSEHSLRRQCGRSRNDSRSVSANASALRGQDQSAALLLFKASLDAHRGGMAGAQGKLHPCVYVAGAGQELTFAEVTRCASTIRSRWSTMVTATATSSGAGHRTRAGELQQVRKRPVAANVGTRPCRRSKPQWRMRYH